MQFLVLSEDQVINGVYRTLNKNHILISITDPGRKVNLPKSQYCKNTLSIQFKDIEQIEQDSFNRDLAKQILDFVNLNCSVVDLVVCHCYAGLSRSNAVASALSKILNHTDDLIFSKGIPNMLTYVTLLDVYFSDSDKEKTWSSIYFKRDKSMKQYLSPSIYRIWNHKTKNKA